MQFQVFGILYNFIHMNDKFYIGIDSGGTNCRISLYCSKDGIKHSGVFNSVHYSAVGTKSFSKHTSEIVVDFLKSKSLFLSDCTGICAGIAGARLKASKEDIKKHLSEDLSFFNLVVESDTAIAFEDAFGTEDGLILICGTGSVLFGKLNGEFVRLGGWGKLLGDDGSSYFIGLNFLKRLVKHFDKSTVKIDTENLLYESFSLHRDNIIDKVYHKKFDVASLAPFVVEQAEKGDAICREVIEKEIEGVYELFDTFKSKYGVNNNYKVAFTGTLIESDNYFSLTLKGHLKQSFQNHFVFLDTKVNPVMGAVKIALRNFKDK
jgi:N-acetylglucosamine kinase-like BadF-type ATPase